MRRSPIRDILADRGAVFEERAGVEVATAYSSFDAEYNTVRNLVGLTDFSFTTRYRISETGLDIFDRYATGSVANIRFGRILHTMAVNDEGLLEADLYIANDDENFILLSESLIDDDATAKVFNDLGPLSSPLFLVIGSSL